MSTDSPLHNEPATESEAFAMSNGGGDGDVPAVFAAIATVPSDVAATDSEVDTLNQPPTAKRAWSSSPGARSSSPGM